MRGGMDLGTLVEGWVECVMIIMMRHELCMNEGQGQQRSRYDLITTGKLAYFETTLRSGHSEKWYQGLRRG